MSLKNWFRLDIFLCAFLLWLAAGLYAPRSIHAAPGISSISDNRSLYTGQQIPKFGKLEITFQVQTQASNPQFPFLSAGKANQYIQRFVNQGISVDAILVSPSGQEFRQPGFYFQEFDESLSGSNSWYYPTDKFSWKVRFSPDKPGTWRYRLQATDQTGTSTSAESTVTVSNSTKKGFIQVSRTDSRYFEYDDGSYFPALGYHSHELRNDASQQLMQQNGIQFIREWMMSNGTYGSQWTHFRTFPGHYDGYLPRVPTIPIDPTNSGTKKFYYIVREGSSWFEPCMFAGHERGKAPLKPSTNYLIRIPYVAEGITGPRISGSDFGVTIKIGGWLDNCGNPNIGTSLVPLQKQNGSGEIKLIWNSGSAKYLDHFYVVLENATAGSVYMDRIDFHEMTGGTVNNPQMKSFNVLDKPNPNEHLYMNQRSSYDFDKFIERLAQRDIYIKAVVMEKEERTFRWLNQYGELVSESADNFYGASGNCSNCRELTAPRWLQEAWFRYLQARWGYSPNIHSWELVNEGNPGHNGHFALTDEMGKVFKCRVFGIEVPYTDGAKCNYDHPNAHPVTTSFWHSFPANSFWKNAKYPNVDFADVHAYISTSYAPCEEKLKMENDAAYYHIWHSQNVSGTNIGKPVIRGEAGMDGHVTDASKPCGVSFVQNNTNLGNHTETTGVWFHNYLWAQLHPGGMMETYWWVERHIVDKNGAYDHRHMVKPIFTFIQNIPLNNGNYQDVGASSSNALLRIVGQKDTTNHRAHLWVQNVNHTWKNVADKKTISQQSGTITIGGFTANKQLMVERWDTWNNTKTNSTVTTSSQGQLTLNVSQLAKDTAFKIGDYSGGGQPGPSATPTTAVSGNWKQMLSGWLGSAFDRDGNMLTNSLDWTENLIAN